MKIVPVLDSTAFKELLSITSTHMNGHGSFTLLSEVGAPAILILICEAMTETGEPAVSRGRLLPPTGKKKKNKQTRAVLPSQCKPHSLTLHSRLVWHPRTFSLDLENMTKGKLPLELCYRKSNLWITLTSSCLMLLGSWKQRKHHLCLQVLVLSPFHLSNERLLSVH